MSLAPGVKSRAADTDVMTAAIKQWHKDRSPIPDGVARAIAQLYHSPGSPAVTALSHGLDFDPDELAAEVAADETEQPDDDHDTLGRPALRALAAWLESYR